MQKLLLTVLAVAAIATPQTALAHALETQYQFLELPNAEAGATTNRPILLTSQYSTGEPLVGAEVLVYAPDNWDEPRQLGKTDAEGQFAFLPDTQTPGNWEVMIQQTGHGDLLTIPVHGSGADLAQIRQGEKQDQHYGTLPLNEPLSEGWSGAIAIAALGIGVGLGLAIGRSGQRRAS
ncbi:MAG: carboxypeptidase regulatory-like domain-containing protein [Cyanobacteria bacterium P01_G01_bin.54]